MLVRTYWLSMSSQTMSSAVACCIDDLVEQIAGQTTEAHVPVRDGSHATQVVSRTNWRNGILLRILVSFQA